MKGPAVRRFESAEELARAAAQEIVDSAAFSAAEGRRWCAMLAGGSTPRRAYEHLAAPPYVSQMPWADSYLFVGDERWVPVTDKDSNGGSVRTRLVEPLTGSGIQVGGLFLPVTESTDTNEGHRGIAARSAAYELEIATVLGAPHPGPPPSFDLVMLGMGPDGHIASIFPDDERFTEPHALKDRSAEPWVAPVGISVIGRNRPEVPRITVSLDLICAARRILLMITGAQKLELIERVLSAKPGDAEGVWELPVSRALRCGRSVTVLLAE